MGWKNSPHIFCTEIETEADLANTPLHYNDPALPHRLDDTEKSIFREELPNLQTTLEGLIRDPLLR